MRVGPAHLVCTDLALRTVVPSGLRGHRLFDVTCLDEEAGILTACSCIDGLRSDLTGLAIHQAVLRVLIALGLRPWCWSMPLQLGIRRWS